MPDYEPHLSQKWLKCYTMGPNCLSNCMSKKWTVMSKNYQLSIQMQHWRRPATDGTEFWISCKQPAFLISFSHLQLIQNKRRWCSATAHVTAGFGSQTCTFMSEQQLSSAHTKKVKKTKSKWINFALKQETVACEIAGHNNSNETTTSNGFCPIDHAMAYHWNFTTKGKLTIELQLRLYEINWDEKKKKQKQHKTTNFLLVLELWFFLNTITALNLQKLKANQDRNFKNNQSSHA